MTSKCPFDKGAFEQIVFLGQKENFDKWNSEVLQHVIVSASGYIGDTLRNAAIESLKKYFHDSPFQETKNMLKFVCEYYVKQDDYETLREYVEILEKF